MDDDDDTSRRQQQEEHNADHSPSEPQSPPPSATAASLQQYVSRGIEPDVRARMGGWHTEVVAEGSGLLFESEVLQVNKCVLMCVCVCV